MLRIHNNCGGGVVDDAEAKRMDFIWIILLLCCCGGGGGGFCCCNSPPLRILQRLKTGSGSATPCFYLFNRIGVLAMG